MSTILHSSPIYGPVHSRRMGLSLGINLMPEDGKICTFDCIYCECGFNQDREPMTNRPTREEVAKALETRLKEMSAHHEMPNVLTFAGNGEPTGHPQFPEIVDDTIALRDRYCPEAAISVLSNATLIHRKAVYDALMKIDKNIMKLDTADIDYIKLVDRPVNSHYDIQDIIESLQTFQGHVIIQTMFMKGWFEDRNINNTQEKFVGPWLKAIRQIMPSGVMIYTIDRKTPAPNLEKATHEELDAIAERVRNSGIACHVSY